METRIYSLEDYNFDSGKEQYASRLDKKKINYLQSKDKLDYKEAVRILKKVKKEKITFESEVGKEYLESLNLCIARRKRKRFLFVVKLCCYIVILACFSFFTVDGFFDYCSKKNMSFLQQRATELKEKFAANAAELEADAKKNEIIKDKMKSEDDILLQYKEFYADNPYFAGWVTISDTGINYPVMQGPDNEYYLSHNMQNEYDKYGLLVMDTRCSDASESPQYIVYGHNARTGSMFGELKDYRTQRYYEMHPTITFDTLYESSEYDIVSVFTVSLAEEAEDVFYEYTDFPSKEIFDNYIDSIKEMSFYDTGIEPEYGDELLSLVTCENSIKDGRFVVVASNRNE